MVVIRLGVKDMRLAEAQAESLNLVGMFVQQESKIGRLRRVLVIVSSISASPYGGQTLVGSRSLGKIEMSISPSEA